MTALAIPPANRNRGCAACDLDTVFTRSNDIDMDRESVIARIGSLETRLRAFGVAALYLYGSHARDDARPDSDIDVLVDIVPGTRRDLHTAMGPQIALEKAFPGVEIGCSTREGLHPLYRPHIERTLVRVF